MVHPVRATAASSIAQTIFGTTADLPFANGGPSAQGRDVTVDFHRFAAASSATTGRNREALSVATTPKMAS